MFSPQAVQHNTIYAAQKWEIRKHKIYILPIQDNCIHIKNIISDYIHVDILLIWD